jgi:hypothetical protein
MEKKHMSSDFAVNALLERGQAADYPAIARASGGAFALVDEGRVQWEQTLPRLSPAELREISHALAERAARLERDLDAEEKRQRRDEAPDAAVAGQMRIEAEMARQAHEAERPRRVEELLQRIAAAVEGLARR